MSWRGAFALLVLGGAAATGLLAGTAAQPQAALDVRDLDGAGRRVAVLPLGVEGRFVLTFTHSMYGGMVAETFRVVGAPPRLVRESVRTETGGAADYYGLYGNVRREGAGWVVDVPPLEVSRLVVQVDAIGRPRLLPGVSPACPWCPAAAVEAPPGSTHAPASELSLLGLVPAGHRLELQPAILAARPQP